MKISRPCALMLALVAIAIGIGVYIYATLFFRERLHVLIITVALCCLSVVLGIIVTRPNMRFVSIGIMILGIVAIGISLYLLHAFQLHERAYTILGIGILFFLGGLAGIITQSIITTLSGMVVLGIVALSIGFNLACLDFHRPPFFVLCFGAFCILSSLLVFFILH